MADLKGGSPQEFKAMIEGKSDDEINAGLKATGVDTALGQIFQGMAEAFLPEKAGSQSAVIQYDVTSPEGKHSYQLKVAGGKCQIAKGAPESARVTLGLSAPDFMRLIAGKLDGQTAFFQGKLKLSGDMMFAQTMQSWFKKI